MSSKGKQINLCEIREGNIIEKEKIKKYLYVHNVITKNNKINPNISFEFFINKHNLKNVFYSINHYFPDINDFLEKLFLIINNLDKIPECNFCKNPSKYNNYKKGYNPYCSHKCYSSSLIGKKVTSKITLDRLSISQKKSWKTRDRTVSIATRKKMSDSAKKSIFKKKITNMEKYGAENPGVLGAYSSKSATKYIKEFIKINNIDPNCCMYSDKNNKEFFQMIYVDFLNKNKYFSYDLVVFKSKNDKIERNIHNIVQILEYNGPWHYKLNELTEISKNEPFTPYKNCKFTKYQSYILDKIKLDHMLKITKNISIYWENKKILEKYS